MKRKNDYEKNSQQILKEASHFGSKGQKDGTVLLGHVPHVAPEAWFHILFAPLHEKRIQSLEGSLKREIPGAYRKFLSVHNGLILFSGSLSLDGYRKAYDRTSDELLPFDLTTVNLHEREDSEARHFFIGGYDWDGSLLYIDGESPKIYRCSRESAEPLNDWANLDSMLETEISRLNKLFKTVKRKTTINQLSPERNDLATVALTYPGTANQNDSDPR